MNEFFTDDFESGDLTAWDSYVDATGTLAADTAADYWGDYGLKATFDTNTTSIYVQDDTPSSDERYRARFYFDPNGVTIGSSEVPGYPPRIKMKYIGY